MPLTIVYQPMSAGKLRFWETISLSFDQLKSYGECRCSHVIIRSEPIFVIMVVKIIHPHKSLCYSYGVME